MINYEQISDMDVFFYYGQNELQIENESDLVSGIMQDKRSLFYNRRDSAGLNNKENNPNTIQLIVLLRFDIVNWVSYRNTYVTNGSDNEIDRRIGVSQNFINFKKDKEGNLDVDVSYVPFADYDNRDVVSIPIGGV